MLCPFFGGKLKMRIARVLVKHKLVDKYQLFLNLVSVPEQFCFTLTAEFLFYCFDEFCVYLLYILLAVQRSFSDRRNEKHEGRINVHHFYLLV